MKTSAFGIKAIAKREGTILHVYKDSKGLPTAGVGHLITAAEKAEYPVGKHITQAQSDQWLAADLKECEDAVNSLGVSLKQNEFDALVSLTFNIGVAGFKRSTVARRLRAGDKKGAAEAILMWNKPPEIQGRRRTEYNQFLTPYKVSAAADQDLQPNGAVSDATSNPLSDSPIQPPNDHKEVKAEITPDGGVKMSSTEGPPPPKERIAIVKSKPKTWAQAIVAKITAAVSGNALFQWIWGQQDKITGLSVPSAVWIIVSLTIAIGFLLWIVYEIIAVYRSNKYQENIDALLVKENSTADNLVQLIPADEVDLYRTRGFKIITRGESVAVQK
jgi:lysozyme